MTPVRRPRRRPRVRSLSWKILGWVLVREAALRVLWPTYEQWGGSTAARQWLCRMRTDHVREVFSTFVNRYPDRRIQR